MRRFIWGAAVAVIWAFAAGVLSWELTVPLGVCAAVLGALTGLYAGWRAAASRVRLPVIWCVGLVALLLAVLVSRWMTREALVPAVLGPGLAFRAGELLAWFGAPLLAVGLLRASSLRAQGFVVLELGVVGAVFAGVFAAHRGGFINRPYFLVDPLWARGYDPLPIFLAIGVGIAGLLIILAAHRGSTRRSVLDVALLLAIVAAIFLVFPVGKLKDLPPPGGGGTGKDAKGKGGDKSGSGAKGASGQSGRQGQGQGSQGGNQGSGTGQGDQGQGASGSENAMSSFSSQQSSPANPPVAVVLFRDDYDPPIGYYYFRQTAFSQFNGERLVQDTTGRADLDVAQAFPSGTLRLPSVPLPKEAGKGSEKPVFRAIDTTVALLESHARPFLLINPLALSGRTNPDPKRFQRAYDVTSLVLTRGLPDLLSRHVGSGSWDEALWKHYTEAPQDPRYAELAAQATAILKPELRERPIAQALAVKLWLDHNGTYSLQSRHDESPAPVADFLFGDRTGHCVYFAHSACLLMRSLGVPARVSAGYAVEARNRGEGSSLMVRAKDAHAWPEIYLEGAGWIPLDISPEKSVAPPEDAPDQGLQQMLGEMARKGAGNPKDEMKAAGRGDVQEALKKILRGAAWLAALLLLALVALAYAVKLYRRLAPAWCANAKLPRLAYRSALDRLAEAGFLRGFGQTRESFAGALSDICPSFARLTAIHLDRALGRGRLSAAPDECRRSYERALGEFRGKVSGWRRFFGALNPVSWVRVK